MSGTVNQIKDEIQAFADSLPHIAEKRPLFFEQEFHDRLATIDQLSVNVPDHKKDLTKLCFEVCAEELDKGEINRRIRYKPFGYAGDFLTVDWIYTRKISSRGVGRLWDQFAQRQAAAEAIRARNDFFCEAYQSLCEESSDGMSILQLASGPCRDVVEAVSRAGPKTNGCCFHCVDIDERAIHYAKNVVQGLNSGVTFEWEVANIFRIRPSMGYDLVWAAGLFDYLNDRLAIALLKRMWKWTKPGGRFVIGNVQPGNPTRHFMEWCLDWFLIHRTEDDICALCEQAEIPHRCVELEPGSFGVFQYCIVHRV